MNFKPVIWTWLTGHTINQLPSGRWVPCCCLPCYVEDYVTLSPRTTRNCSLGQGNDVPLLMAGTVIWLFDITITRKLPRLRVSSCLDLIWQFSLSVFCNGNHRIHSTTDSQRMRMQICKRSN